jgi:hypothetical protein
VISGDSPFGPSVCMDFMVILGFLVVIYGDIVGCNQYLLSPSGNQTWQAGNPIEMEVYSWENHL